MKACSKCYVVKGFAEFSKQSDSADKYSSHCKVCSAARLKDWVDGNKERRAESKKLWREKNKDRLAECRKANKDRKAVAVRAWYEENKERLIAIGKAWSLANPEKISANVRNRRARLRNAEGTHTAADIKAIFGKQNGLCVYCETKLFNSGKQKYHVDHIMPLKLGGSNWAANLQCLCPTCNLRKSAKHPADWAKQIALL